MSPSISPKIRALCPLVLLALSGCATPTNLYLQGEQEARQGHLTSALAAFSTAIRENPRLTPAYIARANVYRQQGRIEEAAGDYEQVVRLEPNDFAANFQLGVLYQQLRKSAQAIPVFKRAVELRPDDLQANMNLALSYLQNGQAIQGLSYARRAVLADDQSAAAHANLGVLYARMQWHEAAIGAFKRSLELDDRQSDVYVNLGQEYLSTQSYELARSVLETAGTLAPSTRVSERLGATYYELRQFDKAEEAYRQALRLEPRNVAALNGLGAVLISKALLGPGIKAETAGEAVRLWRRSLELDRNQPTIENLVNQYAPQQ